MVVVLFFFVSAAAFAAFINFADSIEDCGGQTNFGLKMATDLELPPSCLPRYAAARLKRRRLAQGWHG